MKPLEILTNPRWQNHKERPNGSTNNEYMVNKAEHVVVNEWVFDILSNYRKA